MSTFWIATSILLGGAGLVIASILMLKSYAAADELNKK